MPNHVAIAALVVDAFGAVLLARAVAFQRAEQYGRENSAGLYPRATDLGRDAGRARDVADAQAGALLLFMGFVGQGIAAWQSEWSSWTACLAYVFAVVLIAVVMGARPWLMRRWEGQLYVARVAQEFRRWEDDIGRASRREAQAEYRSYLAAQGREAALDRWAERAKRELGVDPRSWESEEPAPPPPP